jgi:hypothetical protein
MTKKEALRPGLRPPTTLRRVVSWTGQATSRSPGSGRFLAGIHSLELLKSKPEAR